MSARNIVIAAALHTAVALGCSRAPAYDPPPSGAHAPANATRTNATAAIGFAIARSGTARVSGRSIHLDLPACTAGTAEALARVLPHPEDIDDVECVSSRATTLFYLHPPDAAPK